MESLRQWQLDSIGHQQTFYEQFGDRDWDCIQRTDSNALNTKLAFVFYGKPLENCAQAEAQTVNRTRSKLLELSGSGDVYFGCVFVCTLMKNSQEALVFPLIRTKKSYGDDLFFIERQPGRVYIGWRDFLENNKLAKCVMCYPVDGFYKAVRERVCVQFKDSPSCASTYKILDAVSVVGKMASSGLLAVSVFFPVITPVLVTAGAVLGGSAVYSTSRHVAQLVDRGKHHQSISLCNGVARSLWIEISNDIIGSVLVGGAAVLPRLVASGRLATTVVTTTLELLSWASVGVNSFGIVANIATLILKCREGNLQKCDVDYFVTACLFIGNLILNSVMAEKLICELSNQFGHAYRIFKMTTNTVYKTVKSMICCCSLEFAIGVIGGHPVDTFFRYFDMQYTLSIIVGLLEFTSKFRRKEIDAQCFSFELYKLLVNHFGQIRAEVEEAAKKIQKLCQFLTNKKLTIGGKELFRNAQLFAPDVTNSVSEVMKRLDETEKEHASCDLMRLAVQFGRKINVENERQFADVCKILMSDIKSRCDRRIILETSSGKAVDSAGEQNILDEVIKEFRDELRHQVTLPEKLTEVVHQSDGLYLRPLYKLIDVDVYVFEASSEFLAFDKFINMAACKLFGTENIPACAIIHGDDERLIVIQFEEKTVLFFYEVNVKTQTIFGLAMLMNEPT